MFLRGRKQTMIARAEPVTSGTERPSLHFERLSAMRSRLPWYVQVRVSGAVASRDRFHETKLTVAKAVQAATSLRFEPSKLSSTDF